MNQIRETDILCLCVVIGCIYPLRSPTHTPTPDSTTPNRSRQCKSVSTVQRRRRRPPGNRGDSQLTAGRPLALTAPPGRPAPNMKK